MAILLFADHDNASLSEHSARALGAALQIGPEVDILIAGQGARAAADAAAALAGVRRVLLAEAEPLAERLAEPTAALIVQLAGDYDTILAPATSSGKNVLPRVAALLDVMQISEVTQIVAPDTFKRPIYAGNAIEVVQSTDALRVLTIRSAGFAPAATGDGAAPVVAVDPAAAPACPALAGTCCRSATVPTCPRRGSSCRAAGRLGRKSASRR